MNRFFQLSVAVIIVAATLSAYPWTHAQDNEPQVNPEIRKLLIERRDIFRELVELIEERIHGSEQLTPDQLWIFAAARNDLLEAEIALATNPEERVQLLEAAVEVARRFEVTLKDRHESGDAILRATANRIQAEVRLLKAAE